MKRYDPIAVYISGAYAGDMRESSDGDFYFAADVDARIAMFQNALRLCVESMEGYRRELPHPEQPCDAERLARELIAH